MSPTYQPTYLPTYLPTTGGPLVDGSSMDNHRQLPHLHARGKGDVGYMVGAGGEGHASSSSHAGPHTPAEQSIPYNGQIPFGSMASFLSSSLRTPSYNEHGHRVKTATKRSASSGAGMLEASYFI